MKIPNTKMDRNVINAMEKILNKQRFCAMRSLSVDRSFKHFTKSRSICRVSITICVQRISLYLAFVLK